VTRVSRRLKKLERRKMKRAALDVLWSCKGGCGGAITQAWPVETWHLVDGFDELRVVAGWAPGTLVGRCDRCSRTTIAEPKDGPSMGAAAWAAFLAFFRKAFS
jgi:hypothetical protein